MTIRILTAPLALLLLLLLLLALAPSPGWSEAAPQADAAAGGAEFGGARWTETRAALFERLKSARSPAEARFVAGLVWLFWSQGPTQADTDLLAEAMALEADNDLAGALERLERLVIQAPNFAEGWNRRATVLFLMGDYDASLADVARVLALEPKHFGALSGKSMILRRQGHEDESQEALREALSVYPLMRERALLKPKRTQDI